MMDKDRLNHSYAVANKMVEYGDKSIQYINCAKLVDELLKNPINKDN